MYRKMRLEAEIERETSAQHEGACQPDVSVDKCIYLSIYLYVCLSVSIRLSVYSSV